MKATKKMKKNFGGGKIGDKFTKKPADE